MPKLYVFAGSRFSAARQEHRPERDCLPAPRARALCCSDQDLDAALKVSCEELIAHLSLTLTSPLRAFLDRCTAFLSSPSAAGAAAGTTTTTTTTAASDLVAQEWANPDEVLKLHAAFRETVRTGTEPVVRRLRIYLVDDKTVGVLVPPLWVRALPRSFSLVRFSELTAPFAVYFPRACQEDVVDTYTTFYNRECWALAMLGGVN